MSLTIRADADLAAASVLYGLDVDEMARRFASAPPLGQWIAYNEAGEPVGVATATERVDGRVFVTHRLSSETTFAPLLEAALGSITGPVHVIAHDDQGGRLATVRALGMTSDLSSVTYAVPFTAVLDQLPHRRGAGRFDIVRADEVDPDALFVGTAISARFHKRSRHDTVSINVDTSRLTW